MEVVEVYNMFNGSDRENEVVGFLLKVVALSLGSEQK